MHITFVWCFLPFFLASRTSNVWNLSQSRRKLIRFSEKKRHTSRACTSEPNYDITPTNLTFLLSRCRGLCNFACFFCRAGRATEKRATSWLFGSTQTRVYSSKIDRSRTVHHTTHIDSPIMVNEKAKMQQQHHVIYVSSDYYSINYLPFELECPKEKKMFLRNFLCGPIII